MNNQKLAFEKFTQLKVGALFMKMGSGKTKVAIELVNYNIDRIDTALFIAPNSTLTNLAYEIKKWNVQCEYILKSYENISQSRNGYLDLLKAIENKKVFIIADESIFIKNEDSLRFKRLLNIRKKCDYALILNGTPLTKNEWDLYNQMYFLSPLIINMSREEFLNTFFKHIKYKKRGEPEKEFYKFSEINAEFLTNLVAPYIFACDLEYPIVETTKELFSSYTPQTSNKYVLQKERLLQNLAKEQTILGNLQLLVKIAAEDERKAMMIAYHAKNKQLIIYCQFLSEVRNIYNALNKECYIITGLIKKQERINILENFKKDQKPLIITFGTGAFGLNLQFCNKIIYSSLSFDYGAIEQSQYRIKRIGQTNKIEYVFVKTGLGIENLVNNCIIRKIQLSQLIRGGFTDWQKYI